MRVLVENGSYDLMNLGDVAALQVALARLGAIWPEAELHVPTRARARLARLCPVARAVEARALPLASLRERLYRGHPRLRGVAGWARRALRPRGDVDPRAFDLVVACGGGYVADPFREHAMRVLETLHAAARAGRPIVMLGQGLGPIGDRSLWRVAREVLPRLHLLFVRDACASLRLAGELGVAADRIVVTGDDTIEMARVAAPAALGGGLGVNIRAADYAGIGRDDLGRIGPIVRDVARQLGSFLVPLPVSGHPTEPDSVSIGLALDGRSEPLDAVEEPRNPRELIGRVGRCRVVVTGSYHAGVFALAQGIPVVALTATQYYADKFAGLEERFPVGCGVVSLRDPGADDRLRAAIAVRWEMAERVRPRLLEAADEQIRSGWSAYSRLETGMAAGRASS